MYTGTQLSCSASFSVILSIFVVHNPILLTYLFHTYNAEEVFQNTSTASMFQKG